MERDQKQETQIIVSLVAKTKRMDKNLIQEAQLPDSRGTWTRTR